MTERKETPQQRYDKENIQFVGIKLNKKTDKDILDALEGKAKQTEIKRLVRLGLQAEEGEQQNGMTNYQLAVFLKLQKALLEKMNKDEFVAEIDEIISQLSE